MTSASARSGDACPRFLASSLLSRYCPPVFFLAFRPAVQLQPLQPRDQQILFKPVSRRFDGVCIMQRQRSLSRS